MAFSWASFLNELSRHVLPLTEEDNAWIQSEYRERRYLGHPPATEEQIQAAEMRLATRLPRSYRAFLQASNGWAPMGAASPGRLWSTGEIEWLSVRNQQTIETWGGPEISAEEHLQTRDFPESYNGAYMRQALEVGDWGDACILFLCPEVVTPEGEWECWELASWHPGAQRFESFQDWFVNKSNLFLDERPRD